MELLFEISELLANLIDGFGAVIFLWLICGRKKEMPIHFFALGTLISGISLSLIPTFVGNVLPQIVLIFADIFIYALVCLEQSVGKKIYFTTIWNILLMITNLITVYGMVFIFKYDNEIILQSGSVQRILLIIINKIMLVFIAIIFIYYNNRNKLDYKQWSITVIQFIGTLFIGAIFVNMYMENTFDEESSMELILISILLLIMCIVVCVCQHIINIQNNYKVENEKLKTYLAEEEKSIQRIEDLYERSSILRHDIKHYAIVIKDLLKQKRYFEAEDILNDMVEEQLTNDTVFYTSNNSLNAVLNNKLGISKKHNISFEVEMSCNIQEKILVNVCVILSNLLDNAIEAEKNEIDGYIKTHISMKEDMLCLSVVNKISNSVIKDNPKLKTTKENKREHGFGIKSIEKRVKEMDGIYTRKEDSGEFKSLIYIPIA